jgi:hypothetical protein
MRGSACSRARWSDTIEHRSEVASLRATLRLPADQPVKSRSPRRIKCDERSDSLPWTREGSPEANAGRHCSLQLCCFNRFRISRQFRGQFHDEKAKRRSTVQIHLSQILSLASREPLGELVEKPACARDLRSPMDPESTLLRGNWPKSANFSLGAICLGPRIIALDSPAISE